MATNSPEPKSNRQKIIAIVMVIVVIIIIWQVMGLFSGGSAPPPPPPEPTKPMTAAAPGAPGAPAPAPGAPVQPGPTAAAPGTPTPAAAGPQSPASSELREATVGLNPELVEAQKETEQKYIDQLNQLQNLKIQREIAETNQAIAAARLATVTAEKDISDLLTKPATPPPGFAIPGAFPGAPGTTIIAAPPQPAVPPAPPTTPVPPPPEIKYSVISVAMQLGKWSALISHEGKLYNVIVGDVLPPDGSKVICISSRAVILMKGNKRKVIGMVPTIEDESAAAGLGKKQIIIGQ